MPRLPLHSLLAVIPLMLPSAVGAVETSPAESDFFEAKIRPMLVQHCYRCHSADADPLHAGLRVDTADGLLGGGDSGAAIVPGKPQASLLMEAIRYESYEMPPDKKLPEDVIADFAHWIEIGAPDPRVSTPTAPDAASDAVATVSTHWAFQRPIKPAVPQVPHNQWGQSEIDRFVLARLEQSQLVPNPAATRTALLRRLSYDLTGLPPSYEQMMRFQEDQDPHDVETVVDQLLDSPAFGERWGRHWLDVARYADTKGYVFQESREYPFAYQYRDWVVAAFNDDMPYDQFLLAQLAADQWPAQGERPPLAAMGFLTLGRRFLNRQPDIIDDRIDVVTRGLMGLTVSCARCHDHKYDPIPQSDYYSLYGVFASCNEVGGEEAPHSLQDKPQPVDAHVFLRGNPSSRGPQVPRQFLEIVAGQSRRPFQQGSGRLEMAQAIANADNPLTARVWVNRVWAHLFGQGLVETPSDFGTRCDPPSHPELLDWLALRLIEDGWSTKRLIRRIVLSSTYQQSSRQREDAFQADPENRLLWKMNRRRLDLESLRDSLLCVSGRMDRTLGGVGVSLTTAPFSTRRSVYGTIERQNLPGFYRTFDFATPDAHAPQRFKTTVPQQALFLMNSPFAMEQAEHLAATSMASEAGEQVASLYRRALARDPDEMELAWGTAYADSNDLTHSDAIHPDWQYGYGSLNSTTDRIAEFTPLPHFTGAAWQGSSQLPDPQLGWVLLNAAGGHPGNDPQHAAIRRWTAPTSGTFSISGSLNHSSKQGDGVQCRVVSSRDGTLGTWTAQHQSRDTIIATASITAGDTLDFITDCRTGPGWDGFQWTVTVTLATSDTERQSWDSTAGFSGPPPNPLSPWARYAQILLMSNEFSYVD